MDNQVNTNNNMFNYITDKHSQKMLVNGYNAVIKLGLVNFFTEIDPPKDKGYMFWEDDRIRKFGMELESDGHSGSSFAWVCRNLQLYFKDHDEHKRLYSQ
jgi:hypothetical protein